ncbi:MAG: hypothetical protein E6Q97_22690 [Desulfurellales bacterium]|nr:MAG: hypothetical protein E6Q97_22690 [Desulfurellales bacterium]
MPDIINMTITTPPAVNQSITGFGIKGDKGDAGDPATNLVTSVAGKQGVVTLDKTDVGLSNVANLAPADMPVSTAQQTALDGKANFPSTDSHVPVRDGSGAQSSLRYTSGTTGYTIGFRTADGQIGVGAPTDNTHATNKGYVDTALNAKANASDTVNLTGDQTIAGVKTFTSAPIAPSGTSIGGVLYLTGTGFPNGVVTAPVGSTYIDTAVTNGASSWIKKSGTGNTGWQVLEGDTGWRQMKADWNVSPRSSGDGFVERLLIRRVGNRITLACYLTAAFGAGRNHSVAAFLPVGFRNTSSLGVWPEVNRFRLTSSQTTWVDPILETGTAGNLRIITPSPTHEAYSEIAWVTDHPWPTSLPGTAA